MSATNIQQQTHTDRIKIVSVVKIPYPANKAPDNAVRIAKRKSFGFKPSFFPKNNKPKSPMNNWSIGWLEALLIPKLSPVIS